MNYLSFLKEIGKLKHLRRTGWVREGIKNPESVADHSFRTAVMAMVLVDKFEKVDKEKVFRMALIHDIGEAIIGDVVIERAEQIDVKKRDEKEILEKEAIKKIFDTIGQGETYENMFAELIARQTKEANIVWQLDKLERAMQAYEYEEKEGKSLDEFIINAELYMKDPLIKQIFKSLLQERKSN